jgi:hypothetical protein
VFLPRRARSEAARKHGLGFELSLLRLCLSRACLGKPIVFVLKMAFSVKKAVPHPEVRQRERHVADHRGVARARPLPAGGAVEWQNRAAVVHGEVDVQVLHVERERPQVVRLACRTHLSFN